MMSSFNLNQGKYGQYGKIFSRLAETLKKIFHRNHNSKFSDLVQIMFVKSCTMFVRSCTKFPRFFLDDTAKNIAANHNTCF
jgi:hypothetical protein